MAREVELEEMNIIIKVPKDALKVTVKVQVPGYDGEVMKVKKKLLKTDINKARKDFLDNVEGGDDYDAKFVITEKGMEYLKQFHNRENGEAYYDEIGGYHSPCNCYNPLGYYCGDCTKLSCKGCSYAIIEKETPADCYNIPSDELHKELTKYGYWLANKDRRELIALRLGFRNGGDLACHLYHLDND